jgi:hypothetical protein
MDAAKAPIYARTRLFHQGGRTRILSGTARHYNVPLFNGRLHESCNDLGVQEVLFGLLPSFAMSVPCRRFRVQALGLLE